MWPVEQPPGEAGPFGQHPGNLQHMVNIIPSNHHSCGAEGHARPSEAREARAFSNGATRRGARVRAQRGCFADGSPTSKTRQRSRHPDAAELEEFANFLLRIGKGRLETCPYFEDDYTKIPRDMVFPTTGDLDGDLIKFIDHTFPGLRDNYNTPGYFASRAILTPKNADVEAINNMVLSSLPSRELSFYSIDSVTGSPSEGTLHVTEDFLHSLNVSGVPPHHIRLKIGTPIMLIRNVNTRAGICNGTRLRVTGMEGRCLLANVITGASEGDTVMIPRMNCDSSENALPFQLRRRQFPIQLAFAMTINKSQGQTMTHMGLYLPNDVFGHGQVYVALSRVTTRANAKILIEDAAQDDDGEVYTRNVVYRQVIE